MPEEPSFDGDAFDESHHTCTLGQKLRRSFQLGPRYYFRDLPRYFLERRTMKLPLNDFGVLINPLREFHRTIYHRFDLPPGITESLRLLGASGVRLTIPPKRLEALLGAWWATRDAPGDVIECGTFRGATALLLGLLGKINGRGNSVLMLDTFSGIPNVSRYDNTRTLGEFTTPEDHVEIIRHQASALGIGDRVQIHRGLFSETFALLDNKNLLFSFVHIDANIHGGTGEACEFTIPRTSAGGIIVFDDYNGMCDLGARLAIDQFFSAQRGKLVPLAECSVFHRKQPVEKQYEATA